MNLMFDKNVLSMIGFKRDIIFSSKEQSLHQVFFFMVFVNNHDFIVLNLFIGLLGFIF